ncbi:hypothetical protein AT15_07375 [Kosmotoga arenicorallina S304]|uniref:VWFA domain-containing protein n=1 Tax=Kosmotoga arenicorallina S304 TaxID=1453497 RepID=A0A182C742_9BACT|nr:PEGA domain-containing protein [Kosmotoga arenicorallina]OAA31309.1 hypothetical protein AT15_07375 [Kosmotoga arenicorallina S304]
MKAKYLMLLFLLFSITFFSYGVLSVDSYPSKALVYIDGEHLGYTPFSMDAVEGYHRVAIEKKGFEPYEEYVYVDKDTTVRVERALKIRPDYSAMLGKMLVGLQISDFEPEEWLFGMASESIKKLFADINLSADVVSGEALDSSAELGYSGYLDFLLSHSESEENHLFTLSVKYHDLILNREFFKLEKSFEVTGIRENFQNAFLPVLRDIVGNLSSALVEELYEKVTGKIEFLNVDIQRYPEISIIFRAYDESNTPLSLETINNSKLSIIEAGTATSLSQLIPIKQEEALNFTLALDRSGSMKPVIEKAKLAAKDFLGLLPSNSSIALIAFDNEIELIKNFTDNRQELVAALGNITAQGSTPLYDTVIKAVELLSKRNGPRFLVLVTDGVDANLNDTDLGSENSISDAIRIARENNVVIFAIGLGRNIDKFSLGTLTTSTGGTFLDSPTIDDLDSAFKKILEAFENLYIGKYISTGERTALLRIDTPASRIEGKFLIPIPEISLKMNTPPSAVAGMPFEVTVSSLATMTAPINLTFKAVTLDGTTLWEERRLFNDTASYELVLQKTGQYYIELSSFRFLKRQKIEVVPIEKFLNDLIGEYRYPEASRVLEEYLKIASLEKEQELKLIDWLADIELRASLVDGKFSHLKSFLSILNHSGIHDDSLLSKKALFEYLLGDLENFSNTLTALPADRAEDGLAVLKLLQAGITKPENAALLAEKLLKMYPSPLIRRFAAELYITLSLDEKATEIAEEAANSNDLIDLITAAYTALMTGNGELLSELAERTEQFNALKPLSAVWRSLQYWLNDGADTAREYLNSIDKSIIDSILIKKALAALSIASGDFEKPLTHVEELDPDDFRFASLLSNTYEDASLEIEKPLEKKIISWEGGGLFIRARRTSRSPLPVFLNGEGMLTYLDSLTIYPHSLLLTTVKSGVNLLQMTLEDLEKHVLDADQITVILDRKAPQIAIDDYFFTASEYVDLSFTINDDTGISKITLDDEPATPVMVSENNYTLRFKTDRKSRAVVLSATDLAGNISSKKFYVLYDIKGPEIEIKGPSITGSETVIIAINVVDEFGISSLVIDAKKVDIDGRKSFSYNHTVSLAGKDMKTIEISAVDMAGNITSTRFTIRKDHQPPELELKLPTNVVSTSAEITLIATDSGGIDFIRVQDTERKYSGTTSIEDTFEIVLKESGNINIEAADLSGNISRISQYIFVDKIPPVISFAPMEKNGEMMAKITFEDDSGLKYVKVGKYIDKLNGQRTFEYIASRDELTEKLEIVAMDITGKRTEKALQWIPFELNDIAGNVMTSDLVELSGKILIPVEGTYTLEVYNNGKLIKTSTQKGELFEEWVPLSTGWNNLLVVIKTSDGIGIKDHSILSIPRHEAMRVTLTWDSTAADLDLYVREPDGTVVGPMNPSSKCAYINVDARQHSSNEETYILNYKGSFLPEEGDYHIAVHYYYSDLYPNPVNYKVTIDTFDEHIEKEGTLDYFNKFNMLFLSGKNDWEDIGKVFVRIPDKEFPNLSTNLHETMYSAKNAIEIEIFAKDNTGIKSITTDAVKPDIAKKEYNTYGKREVYLNEERFFPDGVSYFNITVEDLFGLKKSATYKIYIDTKPPQIEIKKVPDENGNLTLIATFKDELGLSSVSINGKRYQFDDLKQKTKEFTVTQKIPKGESLNLSATDIVGHTIFETVGW